MKIKKIVSMVLIICMVLVSVPTIANADDKIDLVPDAETTVTITTGGEDAYVYFTPEYSESYTLLSTGSDDTYGCLYDSDMNQLAADDDSGADFNFSITYTLEKGENYVYRINFLSSSMTGTISIRLQTNHDYQEEIVKPATCTEEGQMKCTCSICGYSCTDVIPTLDHDYQEEIVKPATCTEEGQMKYICSTCGYRYTDIIPTLDHDYQEEIVKPATCTEEGQMKYSCSTCGYSYTDVIPASHTLNEDKVCMICGEEYFALGTFGDNLNWSLNKDGVLTISGSGPMTDVDGCGYVPWYSYADEIMEIHIGSEVTTIGSYAFYECKNVRSIVIPDSVGLISSYAFSYCEGLNKITIPDSVYQIAWQAFSQCTNLTSITVVGTSCDISWESGTLGVPGTTVVHGYEKSSAYYAAINNGYTFTAHEYENGVCTTCGVSRMLSGVASETIEWSLDTVTGSLSLSGTGDISVTPWEAYESAVKHVEIGDGITSMPSWCFYAYDELVSVELGDGITEIPNYCFFDCPKLESIELPKTLVRIWDYAFENCSSLTSISFPDRVESIYDEAFAGCTSLEEITFGKLDAPYISADAFTDVVATVYYPEKNATWYSQSSWQPSKIQNYGGTLTWQTYEVDPVRGVCGDNINWTFDDGELSIEGTGDMYDMYYYENEDYNYTAPWSDYRHQITAINMSDGITCIGTGAFYYCDNLEEINLSNDLTIIKDEAFRCVEISSVVIPEGVKEIGDYAFASAGIGSIAFPSTLEKVGQGAFEWSSVGNVYIPSMDAWCGIEFNTFFANPLCETGGDLYVNGELVTDVVIPFGITEIGASQFEGYSSLTSVQIPESVTRVNEDAFRMNYRFSSALAEIVFPASVEYIGSRALEENENLEKIIILNPKCEISDSMYWDYTGRPIIYGYSGSTAETYANDNGFEFVALVSYAITNGADHTVRAGESLYIEVDNTESKIEYITINGLTVDASNYTISEDNKAVILDSQYTSGLKAGEYNMTIFLTDGIATTTLKVSEYEPGDINNDGTLNNKDLTRLFQYLSGYDVTVNVEVMDVNGDGSVNNKDLTRLFQYLSGWDVEIN